MNGLSPRRTGVLNLVNLCHGLAVGCLLFIRSSQAAESKPADGLTRTIAVGEARDRSVVRNVSLHVETGQPVTPFVGVGPFTATWEGFINADLRGNFSFQATLNGSIKVEINGEPVIDVSGAGEPAPMSKPVQLNKGPNPFKATYSSAPNGDSFVRLWWSEKPPFTVPIPDPAFTGAISAELDKAMQLHLGRELFLDRRCFKCHGDSKLTDSGVPELRMDAPTLEGIGARRNYGWMARWILDPRSVRSSAKMPRLLSGPAAKADAEAIAAYLASLKSGGEVKFSAVAYKTKQNTPAEGEGQAPFGEPKPLYERLHCIGCHNPPDATEIDPAKLSQKGVAEKFPKGKLAEFLRQPEAHFAWTRMPNFHLSEAEARELEDWLFAAAPKMEIKEAPAEASMIERGRKLVQTTGCLNCHSLGLENQLKAPALDALHSRHTKERSKNPAGDCLGGSPVADFGFTDAERAALDAFTLAGFASLSRHVPAEFAERQTRALNCTACHGQLDLIPAFEVLGGKLKPEWAAKFIAGDIPHKMRYDAHPKGEPWVESRMPAFRSRARDLAVGMAQRRGYGPTTPEEKPADAALAEVGRKLAGKDGGFSCISCHGVGSMLALEVFESEGINLAYSAERLLPEFYRRWLRAPTSVDPQTKMPVYFDEGKSPLTDILDGDAEKQIGAIWEYLKLGGKMAPPKTGAE